MKSLFKSTLIVMIMAVISRFIGFLEIYLLLIILVLQVIQMLIKQQQQFQKLFL